jgi:Ca2+-binding EF-hand superfamily protein
LYKSFKVVDFDKNGTVDKAEFLAWIDEPNEGSFATQCFAMNDHDNSHTFDFFEFLGVIYNYCSLDREGLVKFAFSLVDKDNSGHLTMDELEVLVHMVYGVSLSKSDAGIYKSKNMTDVNNAMTVLHNLDTDKSGDISFREFVGCVRQHPMLLFPAFQVQTYLFCFIIYCRPRCALMSALARLCCAASTQLQEKVRRRAGGEVFWNETVKTRKHLSAHDAEIIDTLRHIERQDSCPEIQVKKEERKAHREKNDLQGPHQKKRKKKMDKAAKGAGKRSAAGSPIHPGMEGGGQSGGLNAKNVRRHKKKEERAEKERAKQEEAERWRQEEAAMSWNASHGASR